MRRTLHRAGTVAVAAAALLAPTLLLAGPATAEGLAVSVSDARLVPGGQQVVLSGSYSCGPFGPGSDYGVVDLTLTRTAKTTVTGYGYLYLTVCDGTAQQWSSTVDSVGGTFGTGPATVTGSGYACDPAGGPCQSGSFGPTRVRIRR
jgi:hypothetical protein